MRFITTTGYYASGSSAVTDLMREYSCVQEPSGCDFEVSFFFGYHGIPNLYYWIEKGKSHQRFAVMDFYNDAVKVAAFGTRMNYEKYFDGHFIEYTRKYINALHGDKCGTRWYVDYLRLPAAKLLLHRIVNKIYSIKNEYYNKHHSDRREKRIPLFGRKEPVYLYNINAQEFVDATREYMSSLYESISNGKEIVMVDGLIATDNIDDISRYFDDMRLVIVARDPRDVYLTGKYVLKTEDIPLDPHEFCDWYRCRRHNFSYEKSCVMEIRFEDMIYKYEDTVKEIETYFGISPENHIEKKKYFKPEVSANNTKLWKRFKNEEETMKLIEKELSEWVYPYNN